jgi:TRAP-type uncharacterized transport system fused permease subunit
MDPLDANRSIESLAAVSGGAVAGTKPMKTTYNIFSFMLASELVFCSR